MERSPALRGVLFTGPWAGLLDRAWQPHFVRHFPWGYCPDFGALWSGWEQTAELCLSVHEKDPALSISHATPRALFVRPWEGSCPVHLQHRPSGPPPRVCWQAGFPALMFLEPGLAHSALPTRDPQLLEITLGRRDEVMLRVFSCRRMDDKGPHSESPIRVAASSPCPW